MRTLNRQINQSHPSLTNNKKSSEIDATREY